MINLLLLNNFSIRNESDCLLRTIWSLVMVRSQLPAVNLLRLNDVPHTCREYFAPKLQHFLSFRYI